MDAAALSIPQNSHTDTETTYSVHLANPSASPCETKLLTWGKRAHDASSPRMLVRATHGDSISNTACLILMMKGMS